MGKSKEDTPIYQGDATHDFLLKWLLAHLDNPYPNSTEAEELASKTDKDIRQLRVWFNNARCRIIPRHMKEQEKLRKQEEKKKQKKKVMAKMKAKPKTKKSNVKAKTAKGPSESSPAPSPSLKRVRKSSEKSDERPVKKSKGRDGVAVVPAKTKARRNSKTPKVKRTQESKKASAIKKKNETKSKTQEKLTKEKMKLEEKATKVDIPVPAPKSPTKSYLGVKSNKKILLPALTEQELQDTFQEEETIAGKTWHGRTVECYWAFPVSERGFEQGVIIDYRRTVDDTEYSVWYVKNRFSEWEVVDDGFRFAGTDNTPQKQQEIERIIKLRKMRGKFEELLVNGKPIEKEQHTAVGVDYQVDPDCIPDVSAMYSPAAIQGEQSVWNPEKIEPAEVNRFLSSVESLSPPPSPFVRGRNDGVIWVQDEKVVGLETALRILKEANHDLKEATSIFNERGISYSPKAVSLPFWTSNEVVLFELAMRQTPKNWRKLSAVISSKTPREVVQFYWFFKASYRYLEHKRYMKNIRGLPGLLMESTPNLLLGVDRNPRLRQRARVDYSHSKSKNKKGRGPTQTSSPTSSSSGTPFRRPSKGLSLRRTTPAELSCVQKQQQHQQQQVLKKEIEKGNGVGGGGDGGMRKVAETDATGSDGGKGDADAMQFIDSAVSGDVKPTAAPSPSPNPNPSLGSSTLSSSNSFSSNSANSTNSPSSSTAPVRQRPSPSPSLSPTHSPTSLPSGEKTPVLSPHLSPLSPSAANFPKGSSSLLPAPPAPTSTPLASHPQVPLPSIPIPGVLTSHPSQLRVSESRLSSSPALPTPLSSESTLSRTPLDTPLLAPFSKPSVTVTSTNSASPAVAISAPTSSPPATSTLHPGVPDVVISAYSSPADSPLNLSGPVSPHISSAASWNNNS